MNDKVLKKINSAIISQMKSGNIPWHKPWKSELPKNFISKKIYQGTNFWLLVMSPAKSPYWLTFLQCKQKGGRINKGAQGELIVFWKILHYSQTRKKPDGTEEEKDLSIPFLRYSFVFNLADTTLYKDEEVKQEEMKLEEAEKFISSLNINIENNPTKCFYAPNLDFVSVPVITSFDSVNEYYAALFHELVHATGHESRLNRFKIFDFETKHKNYSFEELVAELGSAYLCAQFNISNNNLIKNSSGYLQGWLESFENDYSLFFKASSAAQKAVDYLLNSYVSQIEAAA